MNELKQSGERHTIIWLQYSDGEITWCQDKINDDDVEYRIVSKRSTNQLNTPVSPANVGELLDLLNLYYVRIQRNTFHNKDIYKTHPKAKFKLEMFSIPTQHVYADTAEELLLMLLKAHKETS